jgi:hypothetical protein
MNFLFDNDTQVPAGAGIVLGAVDAVVSRNPTKAADDVVDAVKGAVKSATRGSNAARREVMRQQGIPTSQQPVSQSRNASGRSYEYEVSKPGGGTEPKSVQQQTLDRSHPGQGHWEAGRVKTDPVTGEVRYNDYGRPKLTNDKSKADY